LPAHLPYRPLSHPLASFVKADQRVRPMELAAPDLRLEHAVLRATPASPWSTQSCVPHRQSCRWLASEASSSAAVVPPSLPALVPFTHCLSFAQSSPPPWSLLHRPPRGARSLACHTGSPAGGWLQRPLRPLLWCRHPCRPWPPLPAARPAAQCRPRPGAKTHPHPVPCPLFRLPGWQAALFRPALDRFRPQC